MKALILNSGMGSRMGALTAEHPKCMTELNPGQTVLSRQLSLLQAAGIREAVITTGLFDSVLVNYVRSLELSMDISFVKNPLFRDTNYIYSIHCARELLEDDLLLLHGDLVFEAEVLDRVLGAGRSVMAVSSTAPLPEKDFKAVVRQGRIQAVGVEFFSSALAAQPLYCLKKQDWLVWLEGIGEFCRAGNVKCYAENAFNALWERCPLYPLDTEDLLCAEVDTPEDLAAVSARLHRLQNRQVYMCFSADVLHSAHFAMIRRAARLGKLTVGVLSDEAVCSYKRFPLLPWAERRAMLENVVGVHRVVEQKTLSYRENLLALRPDFVVHGDDWQQGFQRSVRAEVLEVLATYGGRLVEYPYAQDEKYKALDARARLQLSLPDLRRPRLRKVLAMKGLVTALEAHSGITGLIVEKTLVYEQGQARQFDAMWVSSLCDSTARGKPDTELVDMSARLRTVDDILEVTTKPIIFDGDTGGLAEHFVYTVKTLERMGVSMVIIEDKVGPKKNSLFGTEALQTQDSIESFCAKLSAGKAAQKTRDFMICARIESLILEQGMDDALARAAAYVGAGADAIMIHSRREDPAEIFEFTEKFRAADPVTPLVVVPTSFNTVTEAEFKARGVNVVIYANQLTRAGFPAMEDAARRILRHRRAKECDDICMSIRDIITLIPEEG